ncbi:beta-galactosidase [Niastella yeongjuensis]|uniref:Beta-galactosidase n=1 Tax=Niastella yeongjuensis TaxID=354355 RepID=A0A1V9EEN7_9BACT|nr:sugar-binding domain-containing protein [Niastella yeongjuensis]OQP44532.1 beta-galactosidase [Niastella yeongjuensis]SEO84471.1 Glycosyl hydrolases family 2 [Niastella yeongjuensis]
MIRNNLLFLLLWLPAMLHAHPIRYTSLFNYGWRFYKGDAPGAEKPEFNDAAWRTVTLPHDWSIEGPFSKEWASGTGYSPGGIGWYRKTISYAAEWKGKQVFIYFDGVYKNCEVWINGHYLGKRPNGFIPFQYELTKYLKFDSNTIAVKVDHSDFADSRWYTGSGIYRDVHLIVTDPVHIDQWGLAFSTPVVSRSSATANVKVTVVNSSKIKKPITVSCRLITRDNDIPNVQKTIIVAPNTTTVVDCSFTIANPRIWSIENPNIYNLWVELSSAGKLLDATSDIIGFRTIRFDANKGFFLNGQATKLQGVCIHDDAGVFGVAVPEEVWERRLQTLKEGGCNALRLSHNPHADYLYRLCDEMGFVVMDEAFDEWEVGKNKWIQGWNKGTPGKDGYHTYFKEWADRDLRDMILRNRNHPSVIMWSIGNEIDYPNDPYTHEILNTGNNPQIYGRGQLADHPPAARLGEISKHLVQVAKQYDTTRPVTAALAGVVMSNTTSYPGNLDIVGYNYQEYRYAADHQQYPGRVIYDSENGMRLSAWDAVENNPYVAGQFLWTGIDYLGEAGVWPNRSNQAGLLDLGGFPKPEYYFRQSIWTKEPMVYIGTSAIPKSEDNGIWSHKQAAPVWNGTDGDSIRVNCFTNCAEAELFLNGQSLGKKTMADARNRILFWNTIYHPGELIVKGYREGKEVTQYKLNTTGKPATIKTTIYNDSQIDLYGRIQQIEVAITDEKGQKVYGADNAITVSVTGKASLKGIENSDANDVGDYHAATRKAKNGALIVYVQRKLAQDKYEVKLESPGLKPVVLKFN